MFDEPTIGLHPRDVRTLLNVFQHLVEQSATVVMIKRDLNFKQPPKPRKRKQRRQERNVPSREHKQIAPADTGATDHDRLERDEALPWTR